ncbi:hypothetical protein [Desulfatibacillum alkenivorans]|uniref:hypothetical protein n=1 Tax=Desulfatibacillum alkenivorans TaxID=259354 RepID=UPI001115003B|nr:hypothetical protein [Desulfatibacillum alkenivorans]
MKDKVTSDKQNILLDGYPPETQALLRILELGNQQIRAGNVHPALDAIDEIRRRKNGRIA